MSTHHSIKHLNADQLVCVQVLEGAAAHYNWGLTERGFESLGGSSIRVVTRTPLSTFDSAGLTAIVLRAHALRCRVEIGPGQGFGLMEIMVHRRKADTEPPSLSLWERHPTGTDLAALALRVEGHWQADDSAER